MLMELALLIIRVHGSEPETQKSLPLMSPACHPSCMPHCLRSTDLQLRLCMCVVVQNLLLSLEVLS